MIFCSSKRRTRFSVRSGRAINLNDQVGVIGRFGWILSCCSLLSLGFCTGCGSGALAKSPDGADAAKSRPPVPVRIQTSTSKSVARRVVVLGSVRPVRTSVVASGNSGIVEEFLVKEGQFVKAGDTLSVLRMATTDLEIAENRAMLKEREALLSEMKAGYRKQDIEEAASKLLAAEAIRKSTAARLLRVQGLKARGAANQEDLDEAEEKAISS
ncbi:MAG: mdtN 2, partial [Planctomycetaceae bacterium]|nr:mdtN 2 [Planctomycetaceae bacterium]